MVVGQAGGWGGGGGGWGEGGTLIKNQLSMAASFLVQNALL